MELADTGFCFTFYTASDSTPAVVKSWTAAIQLLGLALPPLRIESCVGEVEPPPLNRSRSGFDYPWTTVGAESEAV